MYLSYLLVSVFPHVMGIPTLAYFDQPDSVGVVADQSFAFTWQDNDADMTASFSMYYQPTNLPPNSVVGALTGSPIANGQMMPIQDTNDMLVWDTHAVPTGSYVLYSITTETDQSLPQVFNMSRGVVTVQHPGDPLYPAVVVTDPGAFSPPTGDAYAVHWVGSGAGPLTATVRGRAVGDTDFTDLISDLPMTPAGAKQTGCFVWNLGARPNGYYEVQVEVRDPAGRTHSTYAVSNITLLRDPQPVDAGVYPSCGETAGAADAGVDVADAGGPSASDGGGGCRIGTTRRSPAKGSALLCLGLALSLRRRRR